MNLILSADRNWGIGKDNRLLFRVKADLKFFRDTTLGKTVVMGRRTLESLPGGNPLGGRENVVLTRNRSFHREGVLAVHSLEELFARTGRGSDVFCIGGAEVYELLLPYCEVAYVTRIDGDGEADRFFPDLDALPAWQLEEASDWMAEGELRFRFCRYRQTTIPPERR